ncbi:MAG: hypothetical protein QME41_06995 [Actinomycetota bacterium]|nr:hypothetical protein [Actinomycetota bacterium]
MRKPLWLIIILSLLLVFANLATATAGELWGEAAYATNSSGGTTWAYGTFAKNWVMYNPTLVSVNGVPGKHVNSTYLRYNSQNIIEVGWYRNYPVSSTTTQGFTVRLKNGNYESRALGQMADNQYANFQINNVGTYSFETWINGVRMHACIHGRIAGFLLA